MIQLEIQSGALDGLLRKLDVKGVMELAQPIFEETGRAIIEKAGAYPAPVPGSERSGHLGASWYQRVFPEYLQVGNLAAYAGYMHGPRQRGRAAKHDWKRLMSVAKAEMPELLRKLRARVQAAWEAR